MFAMTSMGAKVIESVNDAHGPYVFKISQLYLFDIEHEVLNRISVVSSS
jgi:hypothetical protein